MEKYTREQLETKSKDELIDIILVMQSMIETLVARVTSLEQEVERLKKPRNSRNSSLPPSQDLFSYKNQSLRQKSNRKTGGQTGHKGHTLEMCDNPDFMEHHFPDSICPCCKKVHATSDFTMLEHRQVIDIPVIKATVTDHLVYGAKCSCGYQDRGVFPSHINSPVQYGTNLTALVSYLSARQFIPMDRMTELIRSITNVSMSQGTVFNMLNRVAKSLAPVYDGIKNDVKKATTVGGDETGLKVNGQKNWAWVWQSPRETYIVNSKNRGFATILENFPGGFPDSFYVSDALSAQLKTTAKGHQLCIAHLLRELNFFIDKYNSTWAKKLKELLESSINLKKRMRQLDYEQCDDRDQILEQFALLISEDIPQNIKKLNALQKRLRKHRHSIFNYLFYTEVPFDNNGSERAIRNVKVKQKVSGGFRSDRGADIFSVIRSVVDTIIKKGEDPLTNITFALKIAAQKKNFLICRS